MAMFGNLKNLIRIKGSHTAGSSEQQQKQPSTETNEVNPVSSSNTDHSNNNDNHTSVSSTTSASIQSLHAGSSKLPVYSELSPRYQIIQKLGEGAFSKVFKAIDHEYGSRVAIKVINKKSMSKSQIEGVFKEISIMRRLDHPNIVKLHDYINTPTRTFIIIEYVSGGELFNQIVRYTYFSEDLARHIIVQVVKAVDYLHSEVGVVHRDIKPENILFEQIQFFPSSTSPKRRRSDDDTKLDEGQFMQNVGGAGIGRIKIADFGLSKVLWDSNTKTPCGTASYTAPEIVKDTAYSKSVDMWAIGCVLYTLLCGFPPFYDTDPKVLTLKVSKGEYTFLSPWWDEISKEAKDLVSHLLTVDPTKRYLPEDVLNHPWILNNSKPTVPAIDSPIFKAKNTSILRFEETIPSVEHISDINNTSNLSPRAEALRFAFDKGISVQRTATPLRRLLEDDAYFNESDDDDSDDSDDDEDEDNDDDDDDDSDDELASDVEKERYTYKTLYKSPVVKKFPKISTPNHCPRKSAKYSPSNSTNGTTTAPHSIIKPKPAHLGTGYDSYDSGNDSKPKQYHFKEMEGFNLNFDGNTLLNRRKMSGSVACGPSDIR